VERRLREEAEARRGDWVWAWCVRACRAASAPCCPSRPLPPSVKSYVLLTPPHVDADASEYPPLPLHRAFGFPTRVLSRLLRGQSHYAALRRSDAKAHPLSSRRRTEEEALRLLGGDASLRTSSSCSYPLLARDASTGRAVVLALVVDEEDQPRWGALYCPARGKGDAGWHDDLASLRPVPVLLRERREGPPPFLLCYCGDWSFLRRSRASAGAPARASLFEYALGLPPCDAVFSVSLARYDSRAWDGDERVAGRGQEKKS